MNFVDVKKSVMLTIAAGKTPLVVGERGIGKSNMMSEVARQLDMMYVNIDGNLLKSGEIGGLPLPMRITRADGEEVTVTDYAIHAKLKQVEDYLISNPEGSVLLFIDELSRCDREVQSELMNLILNREINGYHLSDQVFIVCAMNPSSSNDGFEGNTSYAATEMDAASKNRVVWLYLDCEAKGWLDWGTESPASRKSGDESIDLSMFDLNDYDTMIESSIIEFIASTPNALNNPSEDKDCTASPRSWSFVSDIMRTYELNKNNFRDVHLQACIKGCVGDESYISFMTFLNNNDHPLIKPEEFWAGKNVDEKLLDSFGRDTLPRQMIMAKNINRYLSEKTKIVAADVDKLCAIFELLPIDVLVITMRHIKEQYGPMFKKLTNQPKFVELFMNANSTVN